MTKRWLGALGVAGILMMPNVGLAQSRWGRDDGYGRERAGQRIGYDRGVRDGENQGAHDGRRNERFNYRDERDYRDADNGYRHQLGSRRAYADRYREGFEEGYRRAYRNNSRGGRDGDDRRNRR